MEQGISESLKKRESWPSQVVEVRDEFKPFE